jgi:hypothetical protein
MRKIACFFCGFREMTGGAGEGFSKILWGPAPFSFRIFPRDIPEQKSLATSAARVQICFQNRGKQAMGDGI